ncbi:MOSC domain-containing protein [Embleya scabrispora]|uniref:MOSC domain-containing protein n=1 Tax=Embleya scabrispora TaxID=159449 RepID=UPI000368A703|nr:MOSC N-terminal beta barrel domain-containing protein [Embleya scabrispora]MYS83618.1 MOSC domain-containing protein [Streptomyces sp. SID5474]
MATVVELICYPIKGCAGTPCERALLTPAGLAHDRAFMVVDGDGVFRTQRRDPQLARIRPHIDAAGERLTLRRPDAAPVTIEVDTTGPRGDVHLFGNPFRGIDQGDAAADWLSQALGAESRLVRVPPEHARVTDGAIPGTAGYADSSPLHMLSRTSLDLLNARLGERGEAPLPMTRFRPNVVVEGWAEPHTEDRVRRCTVGEAELGYAKLAIRCAVTLVDQETGIKAGREPLRAFADYRRAPQGGVAFGGKFAVLRPGKLSVGDELAVTEWGTAEV